MELLLVAADVELLLPPQCNTLGCHWKSYPAVLYLLPLLVAPHSPGYAEVEIVAEN